MKLFSHIYRFNLVIKVLYALFPFSSQISAGALICIFAFIIPQNAYSGTDETKAKPIIAVASDGQDTIYVLTSEPGGIYISRDAGQSWYRPEGGLPGSRLFSLTRSQDDRLFITSYEGVFSSADQGRSWSSLSESRNISRFYCTISETCVSVHWTRGLRWSSSKDEQDVPSQGDGVSSLTTQILVTEDGKLWASTLGEGVIYSRDEGRSWGFINDGLGNLVVLSLAWHPGTRTLFAGTLEGGVFKRKAEGPWIITSEGLPEFATVQALAMDTQGNLWAGTHGKGLFVSHNQGLSWSSFPLREDGEISVTSITHFRDKALVGTYAHGLYLAGPDRHSIESIRIP